MNTLCCECQTNIFDKMDSNQHYHWAEMSFSLRSRYFVLKLQWWSWKMMGVHSVEYLSWPWIWSWLA